MAGLLYFLPNLQTHQVVDRGRLSPSILGDRGLRESLSDCPLADHVTIVDLDRHGPGGKTGVLIAPTPISGEPADRLGFFPDAQEWRPAYRGEAWLDRLWIGVDTLARPTSEDLRRRTPRLVGNDIELKDGNTWHVPTVRRPSIGGRPMQTCLPLELEIDDKGQAIKTIPDRYVELWAETIQMTASRWGQATISDEEGFGFAMRVLGLNYRVSAIEQNALRLLDTQLVRDVIDIAIDLAFAIEAVREDQKKTTNHGESITPGSTEDCSTSAPAEAS